MTASNHTLSPQQALEKLQAGKAILIDVRTADEFKIQHIPYALSIPLSDLQKDLLHLKTPADMPIIFQCFKGSRGQQACELMSDKNICCNDIYNIEGGIEGWIKAGQPIIGVSQSQLPIMRQVQIIVGGLIGVLALIGLLTHSMVFTALAGVLGTALFFAGLTGWCGLAIILGKMPWNKI